MDVEGVPVVVGSSSVVVSSSAGGSSYPERETLAEASKNCFQNWDLSARNTELDQYLGRTFEPSHTFFECSAYCSTMGRMLVVTIRWARLKL